MSRQRRSYRFGYDQVRDNLLDRRRRGSSHANRLEPRVCACERIIKFPWQSFRLGRLVSYPRTKHASTGPHITW